MNDVGREVRGPGEGDPHAGQAVLREGAEPGEAGAAAVLVHGRGASARGILALRHDIAVPGVAYLAPQAAGGSWYPRRFMEPLERNEPWLTSALAFLDRVISGLEDEGIPLERTVLVGFSQGACLALEHAARRGGRHGGVAGLSGGLIGPVGREWDDGKGLDGTPVVLGCGEGDPHVPEDRVRESGRVLEGLDGRVTTRLYPDLGHAVNRDEAALVRTMLEQAAAGA